MKENMRLEEMGRSHQPSASRESTNERVSPSKYYAHRVLAHSKLGPGETYLSGIHYGRLGKFLISPYQVVGDQNRSIFDKDYECVTVCDLTKKDSDPARMLHFRSPHEFARKVQSDNMSQIIHDNNTISDSAVQPHTAETAWIGRLVFIRGFSSPQWLNQIGASLDVDPEFLFRHLSIPPAHLSETFQPDHSYLPPSPQTSDIFQLRIYNTGTWDTGFRQSVSGLRQRCNESIRRHLNNIATWSNMSVGESLVRRFIVHDGRRFTIEQRMSVEVIHHTEEWAVVIWSDSGDDIESCMEGPWKETSIQAIALHPVYQHRKRMALEHLKTNTHTNAKDKIAPKRFPQSSTHLHLNYGQYLKQELMAQDAFYALHELFQFSSASIDQMLELTEDSIHRIMMRQNSGDQSELLIAKACVDDLRRSVRDNLSIVRNRGGLRWPRTKNNRLAERAERAATELEAKYVRLVRRCDDCSEQCSNGITNLANVAAREQTQKALEQTDKVTKLTFLAYIFVPLSFTTSFYGMNFRELGDQHTIGIFFATAVPITAFCLVIWFFDVGRHLHLCWNFVKNMLYYCQHKGKRVGKT